MYRQYQRGIALLTKPSRKVVQYQMAGKRRERNALETELETINRSEPARKLLEDEWLRRGDCRTGGVCTEYAVYRHLDDAIKIMERVRLPARR